MSLPNFLIIGAAKAGTTSLYNYLKQHPQIYMSPVKETNFFAFEGEKLNFAGPRDNEYISSFSVTKFQDYQKLFQDAESEIAIGEASPLYLYSPPASRRIHNHLPKVKLIAILRNPVQRAYSHFLMFLRDDREPFRDFALALAQEDKRILQNWEWAWHYKKVGFYYAQLKPYFELFSRSQIKIYLYEDFKQHTNDIIQDIFEFIEVNNSFIPDTSIKHNESIISRNKMVSKNKKISNFLTKDNSYKNLLKLLLPKQFRRSIKERVLEGIFHKPPLTREVRKQLIEEYREDILKLQDLIDRDLSSWLKL